MKKPSEPGVSSPEFVLAERGGRPPPAARLALRSVTRPGDNGVPNPDDCPRRPTVIYDVGRGNHRDLRASVVGS